MYSSSNQMLNTSNIKTESHVPHTHQIKTNDNRYFKQNLSFSQTSSYQQPQQVYRTHENEYSPLQNIQMSQQTHIQQQQQQPPQQPLNFAANRFQNIMSSHSKSHSLPASIQETNYLSNLNNNFMSSAQQLVQPPPPPSSLPPNGDIPLPPGWELKQTANGQPYFINHTTETTSWEDPRKFYNLPMNQIDLSMDMKATINLIKLPDGWEEMRTQNGELYFLNHNTKTTCWEDPRLTIYMQQQNFINEQKQFHSSGSATRQNAPLVSSILKSNNNNSLDGGNRIKNNFSSNSSLSSSSSLGSFYSTASSLSNSGGSVGINNLNSSTILNDASNNKKFYPFNQQPQSEQHELVRNLENLSAQKRFLCSKIDELTKEEINIKSKLTQQDLDEVLHILNNDLIVNNQNFNKENISYDLCNNSLLIDNQIKNYGNISMNGGDLSGDNDMDTTLVTDNQIL